MALFIICLLVLISVIINFFIVKSIGKKKAKSDEENYLLKKKYEDYGIKAIEDAERVLVSVKKEIENAKADKEYEIQYAEQKLEDYKKYQDEVLKRIEDLKKEVKLNEEKRDESLDRVEEVKEVIKDLNKQIEDKESQIWRKKQRIRDLNDLYKAIEYTIKNYQISNPTFFDLTNEQKADIDSFVPSVTIPFNCMNYVDLNKKFKAKMKEINNLTEVYRDRYSTKGNKTIYQMMVIGMLSELDVILSNLKYGKLSEGKEAVKTVINKYIAIATEGNQNISNTIKSFAYQLEFLCNDVVEIEYEYYVKKEQARQEQIALREQMRIEREEQKRLKEQAEAVRQEEAKYKQEIERIKAKIEDTNTEEEREVLEKSLQDVTILMANVEEKKEEIANLQNGKAGYIYVISNLGSFGDRTFKIGMTRRLDPQERIDELGSASVPFSFDVHSFIFSDNAPALEAELHRRLDDRRVNKVNRRKEFFDITIDELEYLVNEVYPSAEFKRTMIAEEYRQSLEISNGNVVAPENDISDNEEEADL